MKLTDLPMVFHYGDEYFTKDLVMKYPAGEHGAEEADDVDPILLEYAIATNAVREQAKAFLDKKKAIMGNSMKTPDANLRDLATVVDRHRDNAAQAIDKANAEVRQRVAQIEAEIVPKKLHPATSAQITSALLGMSDDQRRRALDQADDEVAAAVLHSHYLACGLTAEQKENFRAAYLNRTAPREMRRIERQRHAAAVMEDQIAPNAIKWFSSHIDQKRLADGLAREAAAKKALAGD